MLQNTRDLCYKCDRRLNKQLRKETKTIAGFLTMKNITTIFSVNFTTGLLVYLNFL